jgi:phosphocarrier protein
VALAESFEANNEVSRIEEKVLANSIMGLMMLGAAQGTTLTFDAEGVDAKKALEAIEALIITRFGEDS